MVPWYLYRTAVPQQSVLCGRREWSGWLKNPDHWGDHYNGKIRQGKLQHLQDHALTAEEIHKDWLPHPASLTPYVSAYRFSLASTGWFGQLTESPRRRSYYFQPKIGQTIYQKINVHSVEQKSIGLIFCTSHSGSDMRYSCHYNFTYPITLLTPYLCICGISLSSVH